MSERVSRGRGASAPTAERPRPSGRRACCSRHMRSPSHAPAAASVGPAGPAPDGARTGKRLPCRRVCRPTLHDRATLLRRGHAPPAARNAHAARIEQRLRRSKGGEQSPGCRAPLRRSVCMQKAKSPPGRHPAMRRHSSAPRGRHPGVHVLAVGHGHDRNRSHGTLGDPQGRRATPRAGLSAAPAWTRSVSPDWPTRPIAQPPRALPPAYDACAANGRHSFHAPARAVPHAVPQRLNVAVEVGAELDSHPLRRHRLGDRPAEDRRAQGRRLVWLVSPPELTTRANGPPKRASAPGRRGGRAASRRPARH